MFKLLALMLIMSGFIACAIPEKQAISAKEQVEGIAQMCNESAEAMKNRQAEVSLYSRLGGKEGINTLSSRLYAAHQSNDQIGYMFKHVSEQPFVNNVTTFLVAHSGGDEQYTGRTMTDVHSDLGITHEDFLAAGGDVQNVMKELGYGENETQEAVCFLVSFIPSVVTQ